MKGHVIVDGSEIPATIAAVLLAWLAPAAKDRRRRRVVSTSRVARPSQNAGKDFRRRRVLKKVTHG